LSFCTCKQQPSLLTRGQRFEASCCNATPQSAANTHPHVLQQQG
jgi:hypothetical protein